MKRYKLIKLVLGIAPLVVSFFAVGAELATIDVAKSASCGCCSKWVDHLRASGFTVNVTDVVDVNAVRAQANVPARLAACHTARVGGYVIEGHVPAADIRKLIAEHPRAAGLAVPGMPPAAPGMDVPSAHGYDVLLFDGNVDTRVFHAYRRE